jgi:hypothetical protein
MTYDEIIADADASIKKTIAFPDLPAQPSKEKRR